MRHLSLMCAGMALCMLMNIDAGHASTTTVDDGADEPTSGGGSEQTDVVQDTNDDGVDAEADAAGDTDQGDDGDE